MNKLFEEAKIGSMVLKNRIVMPGMVTNFGSEDGFVTDRLIDYYVERAKGGVGLIIVEGTYIDKLGTATRLSLGMDDDKFIPGFSRLVKAVKAHGTKVFLQLLHVGRNAMTEIIGAEPVAPSSIPHVFSSRGYSRELTMGEIEKLIEKYSDSARRAKDAGFDGVEFHGAHGYLIHQFFSPYTNRRTDRYGGDLEERTRFAREILERARDKLGDAYPVSVRMNATDFFEGGLTIEASRRIAKVLEKAGASVLNVSAGVFEALEEHTVPPMSYQQGWLVPYAEKIKEVVDIPVIAVSRIGDPAFANKIIEEGKADFVAMGRALIADPDLPKKAKDGRVDDIRPCIACNQGCLDRIFAEQDVTCLMNPAVGKERECRIKQAEKSKNVLIVGGGPGGMEASRVAAIRGHNVTLYEKEDRLGGQLTLACVPPCKDEIKKITQYLTSQITKLQVKVELTTEVTPELVKNLNPDVVVLATGAVPVVPEIPGVDGGNVVTAKDVLAGVVEAGKRVVVVGGGEVGCETADFLAEGGKSIVIVEMLEMMGFDMGPLARRIILRRLTEHGVEMLTNAKVVEITHSGITIDISGKKRSIEADSVVIAVGSKPDTKLAGPLNGIVPRLYQLGDCVEARRSLDAIHEGFEIGRKI